MQVPGPHLTSHIDSVPVDSQSTTAQACYCQ
jgi:hypothetical protein